MKSQAKKKKKIEGKENNITDKILTLRPNP